MHCPECHSDDVYLCSVAHEQGTSTAKARTHYAGGSLGWGMSALHRGTADHSSVAQTRFAKRAAPPTNYFEAALGATILSGAAVATIYVASLIWGMRGLAAVLFVLCAVIVVPVLLVAGLVLLLTFPFRRRFRAAAARWRRSWICARCGRIFSPDEDAAGR